MEATTKIRGLLAQKDTVLMHDKEELQRSVEIAFDGTGSATIQWIDCIKKGRAVYTFNGKRKELEFEVPYSSELTIIRK